MPDTGSKPADPSNSVHLDPVLDAMLESMIVIDERGFIEQANKATTDMFGYTRQELLGANISMLMSGADKARHDGYLETYARTGRKRIIGRGREVTGARKDGRTFPADIAVGEINSAQGKRYVGLVRDLTSQRAVEEAALKQREEMVNVSRLSMMGEMAAAMAHELNQPLTAIANFAAASERLLKANPTENADVISDALADIQDQAHRAGEVIRRTRAFTRSDETERSNTSLAHVYGQIAPLAELDAKASNIRLTTRFSPELPEIEVDAVQVQQVMLNLIRNAVDAMQSTAPEHREIAVAALLTAPYELRFEVCDRGAGISDEDADSVFNAFFTTKSSGMGMGLAICRTIIRTHGGELGFRRNDANNPAAGTTFYFTLPTKVKS